jgi:hypothetical protein
MTGPEGGNADVVYVLCLMQATFVGLAGVGEVLLMGGNGLYLLVPLIKIALLVYLGARVVSGARKATIALMVVQGITLVGFFLQQVAGLLPFVDFTINLVGLLTNLALPVVVIVLCRYVLWARRTAVAS